MFSLGMIHVLARFLWRSALGAHLLGSFVVSEPLRKWKSVPNKRKKIFHSSIS